MNIHEYQAKQLLAQYGLNIPQGIAAHSVAQAVQGAQQLAGNAWMVKAQIHAGGRGKAGGIRKAATLEEVAQWSEQWLHTRLVTHQTDSQGQPITAVLIEKPVTIVRELYISLLVDRSARRISFLVSSQGGMDIEQVAARTPQAIYTLAVHPVCGLMPYQAREMAFFLGLQGSQISAFVEVATKLYRLFTQQDVSLLEINPLVVDGDNQFVALDAKMNLDDNALIRHPNLQSLYDPLQSDPKEDAARKHDLNYIALDGDIACMVNGAGLAMATMDLIQLHGGKPANFLDVGGGATAERVAEAFKLILSDTKVKAILVNIFGGIVRCDLIAQGIIQAMRATQLSLPVVARLEGTNVEQGKALLANSGLSLITAENLTDAAQKVVAVAG